ncbi:hypothetical protein MANES_03G110832v8 [Manihot esculenta]|uniref:Uncharacterized protein n=1 Tax=Manihot esculenta TaxID=3983 RepID=A0ACB7I169_MANES|nr:hypothetical protein MANES_03G110832v8 [Manihot esculenta]
MGQIEVRCVLGTCESESESHFAFGCLSKDLPVEALTVSDNFGRSIQLFSSVNFLQILIIIIFFKSKNDFDVCFSVYKSRITLDIKLINVRFSSNLVT